MHLNQNKFDSPVIEILSKNDIEKALDDEEEILQQCCALNGLPYIRPCPTIKTYALIKTNRQDFWCHYINEVQRACYDACPIVYIA